jgi:hypothetical protein
MDLNYKGIHLMHGDLFQQTDNEIPQDDSGIRAEQVLDICDHIISRCWKEIFENEKKDEIAIEKLEKILGLSHGAWILASDVFSKKDENSEEWIHENEDEDDDFDDKDGDFDKKNGEDE